MVVLERVKKIRVVGCSRLGLPLSSIKFSNEHPIRSVSYTLKTPWKEVRIMEATSLEVHGSNVADQMKAMRKVRLQRKVLENPEMARDLVKIQSTGTYNAKGDIIQSVGSLGEA